MMKVIEKAENTEENIAALEAKADDNSALGECLLWVLDDARDNTNAYGIAKVAAAELSALRAQLAEAERERDALAGKLNEDIAWHEGDDSPHANLERELDSLKHAVRNGNNILDTQN